VALDDVPIESITLPARIADAIETKLAQQQTDQEYAFRLSIAAKEAERKARRGQWHQGLQRHGEQQSHAQRADLARDSGDPRNLPSRRTLKSW